MSMVTLAQQLLLPPIRLLFCCFTLDQMVLSRTVKPRTEVMKAKTEV